MSFFRKLFGGGSFDELRAEGDKQFAERDFGAAKISYEKAQGKGKGAAADALAHVEARIAESRDALASLRIEEAERFVREDEIELARSELESAREIAASRKLKDEVTRRLETLERTDARQAADDVHEATDDELYEALAGTWLEEQAEEYDALGEPFRKAYLALHARDGATALPLLEKLAAEAEDARYVWFELGRARLLTAMAQTAEAEKAKADAAKADAAKADAAKADADAEPSAETTAEASADAKTEAEATDAKTDAEAQKAGEPEDATSALLRSGEEALRKFLSQIGPDEGGVTRLSAHMELARLASNRKHDDDAEKELRAATDALPDDTRPWLALGGWLRGRKRLDDAREALRSGVRVMSEAVPDIGLMLELALVERDSENETEAVRLLEAILPRPDQDFLPEVAVPLAELYEKRAQTQRAADVWRHLARGSDVQNHYRYHHEAARTLTKLGDEPEARRMLLRALELAKDDQARAEVKAELAKLGGARAS